MESVGSTKEEGNLNTPIHEPCNIDYSPFSYVLGTGKKSDFRENSVKR